MTRSTIQLSCWLILWGGSLIGALSFASWEGDLGHAICGPWGCGPPLQALIACHLAWGVALTPVVGLLVGSSAASPRLLKTSGLLAVGMAVAALLTVLAHQYFVWWPQVSEFQRPYFWQRYGFVLVTTVDVPIVQVLLLGGVLWVTGFRSVRRQRSDSLPTDAPAMLRPSAVNTDLEFQSQTLRS